MKTPGREKIITPPDVTKYCVVDNTVRQILVLFYRQEKK